MVWATTEEGIRGFLVEKGTKGFETPDIKGKFSLRGSVTSELYLQDVEVPDESRLPKAEGMKAPLSCLTQARYGISWGAIGAAMACYEEVVDYTKERRVQGGWLAAKQLTQEKLVMMLVEITKAQLLSLRVGRLKDEGKLHHTMVSMAKRNNVNAALEIARSARDLLGANGIVDDYQSMRHMVNLETVRTYEGTHDIHTLILGEHITGMRASSGCLTRSRTRAPRGRSFAALGPEAPGVRAVRRGGRVNRQRCYRRPQGELWTASRGGPARWRRGRFRGMSAGAAWPAPGRPRRGTSRSGRHAARAFAMSGGGSSSGCPPPGRAGP